MDLVDYVLATGDVALSACRIGLDAWKALGCRDAGRVALRAGMRSLKYDGLSKVNAGVTTAGEVITLLFAGDEN